MNLLYYGSLHTYFASTYSAPTGSPTVSARPSTSYVPSVVPSASSAPTCGKTEVSNVLLPEDAVETSGCSTVTTPGNAYDGTTDIFECVKDPAVFLDTRKHEIIVSNDYDRSSIVEKLRVYANSDCETVILSSSRLRDEVAPTAIGLITWRALQS